MSLGLTGKEGKRLVALIRANEIHATENGGVNIDEQNIDGTWLSVDPISAGNGAEVTFNSSGVPSIFNAVFDAPWTAI